MELYVIFYADSIKAFDLRTKEFLAQIELINDFDKVEENKNTPYSFFLLKESERVYEVKFSLLNQIQKVQTKSGYILHIGIINELEKGFYTGLYEFGTFNLKNDEIILEKTIIRNSISYGLFHNNHFLVCRSD